MLIGKLKKSSLILLVAFTFLLVATPVRAQATTVFIDPTPIGVIQCREFTVKLNIADVVDLRGWEITLSFDPAAVECISIEEGPFLRDTGHRTDWWYSINNTAGTVFGTCIFAPAVSVSGSGTLAKVTFHCLGLTDTVLHIHKSLLVDPTNRPIPHEAVDGYVYQHPLKWERAVLAKVWIGKSLKPPVCRISSYVKPLLMAKLDKAISMIDMAIGYMEIGTNICDNYLRMAKHAMYEFITLVRSSMFFRAIPGDVGEELISRAFRCIDDIQLAIETPL